MAERSGSFLRYHWWVVTIIAAALWSGDVRADVVMSAPKHCPFGSTPTTSHCGPECAVVQCKSDKDCRKGTRCQATPICVTTGQRASCGRVPYNLRNKKYPYHIGHGPCSAKLTCAKGVCQTKWKVCIPGVKPVARPTSRPGPTARSKPAPIPPPQKKGDCSSMGVRAGMGGGYLLLSMLVVFFLSVSHRRKRR